MIRRRLATASIAVVTLGVVGVIGAPPALAACHAFTVKAAPATAEEGQTVTVTVTRDAAVNPSSVDVSSVDGTAKAGQDFPAVQRTISFAAETSQSFTIVMTDDPTTEPAESFQLQLSNGGGCAINPNFSYGSATVTIAANDASNTTVGTAPTTTRASASPTTTARASSTTDASTTSAPDETTSSSAADVPSESSTTLPTDDVAASSGDDDSGSTGLLVGVLALLAAVAVAAGYVVLRRRAGSDRAG